MSTKKYKNVALIILAAVMFFAVGGEIMARSLADLNRQRQEYRDQQAELREFLAQAQAEQNTILAELILMDLEMMELIEEFSIASMSLEIVTQDLYETEARLYAAEIEREVRFEVLRGRLRFMHENNNLTYIELLLRSQNLTEFMNNREHFRRIIEHDNNIIAELTALEAQIAADRDAIAEQKIALETLTAELAIALTNLEELTYERIIRLEQIAQTEEGYRALLAQTEEGITRMNMAIATEEAQQASAAAARRTGSVVLNSNAPMAYPVALAPHVNSPFGTRPRPFNRAVTEWHTGVDLRAPFHTPILAAESGIVTFVGWRNGYGNTVMINHGGGIVTLYAHNTQNLVRVGDEVARGQQIATAGSTGFSTGSHLHFEVIVNGTPVDPGPFIGLN